MIYKSLALLIAAATIVACSPLERKVAPHEAEVATISQMNVDIRWAKKLPEPGVDRFAKLRPMADENDLYVAEENGLVSSFLIQDGSIVWQVSLDDDLSAGPQIVDGQLLLGTRDAQVISLDKTDGHQLWRTRVSSEVLSPPKQAGDVLVVHTVDGNIVGLNSHNGNLIWTFNRQVPILTLRGTGTPLIVDDKVIVGLSNGKLVALSASDGKSLWESVIALPQGRSELERIVDIDGLIKYDNGTLYVVSFQGRVAAVTIESGRLLWTREMSSFLGLNLDEHNLYVTDADGRIWALDKDSGATLWMQDKLQDLASTVVVPQKDKLVVGDLDGNLLWLSKTDGRILGKLSYLSLIEKTGIFNPADPDELKAKYKRSTYEDDFGTINAPMIVNDKLVVSYRSGVLAYLSLQP